VEAPNEEVINKVHHLFLRLRMVVCVLLIQERRLRRPCLTSWI
jgi:hypothetical protein